MVTLSKSADPPLVHSTSTYMILAFSGISGHVVVPNIEHHAVLNCSKLHNHTLVNADKRGFVSADSVKSAITAETQLVST